MKRKRFIEPGKPVQNAFVESFNGKFRDECLNLHWFRSLHQVAVLPIWLHPREKHLGGVVPRPLFFASVSYQSFCSTVFSLRRDRRDLQRNRLLGPERSGRGNRRSGSCW